jgi:hypothetical protein
VKCSLKKKGCEATATAYAGEHSYRPKGYVPDGCNYCQFNPTYTLKYENAGCSNHQTERIEGYSDKEHTLQECDDLCILEPECSIFFYGTKDTNKGHCIIYRGGCSYPIDPNFDAYTSSAKVNPSKDANVCTHIQANSANKEKRELCSAITVSADCKGNSDCQWTPTYGIKFERGTC